MCIRDSPNDEEWQPGDDDEDHRGKSKKSKKNLDKTTKQQKQSAAGKVVFCFLKTIELDWKYINFFPSQQNKVFKKGIKVCDVTSVSNCKVTKKGPF